MCGSATFGHPLIYTVHCIYFMSATIETDVERDEINHVTCATVAVVLFIICLI